MKCPNCNIEMKLNSYEDYGWDLDYPIINEWYECHQCGIRYKDGSWEIPDCYERPTENQLKTIFFIEKYIGSGFKPLLKKQCTRFISKYLPKAIESNHIYWEFYADDFGFGSD